MLDLMYLIGFIAILATTVAWVVMLVLGLWLPIFEGSVGLMVLVASARALVKSWLR